MRLHPEHGVNPTIPICFFCGEQKNEIILLGAESKRITGKEQAPMSGIAFDRVPCDKCKAFMEQGVIFCSVRDGEEGENPYRTGKWCVVKTEAVERIPIHPPELKEQILKARFCFIPDEAWTMLGLPTEPTGK